MVAYRLDIMKRLLIITLFVLASIWIFFSDSYLSSLLLHKTYTYNYLCAPNGIACVTVINLNKPRIGGGTTKRYIVIGKHDYKLPLTTAHLEYPNDTGLAIIWENESSCKIVSNLPANKIMKLSDSIKIQVIYDNSLYENYVQLMPGSVL